MIKIHSESEGDHFRVLTLTIQSYNLNIVARKRSDRSLREKIDGLGEFLFGNLLEV
jgi:hypothetical protein